MPIPNSEKFENLLASFSISRPNSGGSWKEFVAVPQQRATDGGKLIDLPAISFWFREESDLGLERVLQKIVEGLNEAGHDANLGIAATVVAIFAHTSGTVASAVERLNQVFAQVVPSDLNQFVLVPKLDLPAYRFQVGPFGIGPSQPDRLAYQCQKAGSDYFVRYEQQLRLMPFSIEREFRPVQVIFWHRLVGDLHPWIPLSADSAVPLLAAVNHYFAQISALHFKRFFEELREVQEIPMALGSGWFDLNPVRDLLGAHQISVYLNIAGNGVGFVSPSATLEGNLNLGGGNLGVPFTETFLAQHFRFGSFSDCEICQSIRTYCHFLALGVDHQRTGRMAEGFLHHVIALDLLLGETGISASSVSTRCAALTHRSMKREYLSVVKQVKDIYNARSKYVHAGKLPETALFPLVRDICGEVAFCLFRMQRDARNRLPGFQQRWLKDIDLVVATIEAGRPVAEDDWSRIGAAVGDEVRHADFAAELGRPINAPA